MFKIDTNGLMKIITSIKSCKTKEQLDSCFLWIYNMKKQIEFKDLRVCANLIEKQRAKIN